MNTKKRKQGRKRKRLGLIIGLLILIPVITGVYQHFKSLPEGISYEGEVYQTDSVDFLFDLTYADVNGDETSEQEIFGEIDTMIDEAEEFLVIDMFLFNDDYDHANESLDFPPMSMEFAEKITEKKRENPEMDIVFITDRLNTFYGTYEPEHFKMLREAGVHLVETDVSPLRDSNPIYSSVYRSYLQWGGTSEGSWLMNALRPEGPEVNIRSYLSLLNFKANHRKIVINEKEAVVTSANPHDASFYHSNIAFKVSGEILNDLLQSERSVLEMSGADASMFDDFTVETETDTGPYTVQLVTEKKVKDSMIEMMETAGEGDSIKIGMFYLSDRDVIGALKEALERGVSVQMILDVNQDAFGNEKNGIPNRPVAAELMKMDTPPEIRWYESHGEQYHSKMMIVETGDEVAVTAGSSNFTRRNIEDYNLETNVVVTGHRDEAAMDEVLQYYNRIWNNEDGTYTVEYETYAEDSWMKTIMYRIQEAAGLSTF